MVNNNFQERELSHKCSTLELVGLLLLLLLLSTKNLTSRELEARKSFAFLFDQKLESITTHDLMKPKKFDSWNLWVDLT